MEKTKNESTPVTDPVVLRQLAAGLRISTGQITGITDCVLDENNVFRGKFHQRVTPTNIKSFAFSYGENQITFKPIGREQDEIKNKK